MASEDGRDREQKIVILSDVLFRTFNLWTLFIFSDKFRKTISGSVTEIKRVAKVIFYAFKTRIRLTYIHSLYRLQKLAKTKVLHKANELTMDKNIKI